MKPKQIIFSKTDKTSVNKPRKKHATFLLLGNDSEGLIVKKVVNNLNNKVMKSLVVLIAFLMCTPFLSGLQAQSPLEQINIMLKKADTQEKKDAIAKIAGLFITAETKKETLVDMASVIEKSKHNINTVLMAVDLILKSKVHHEIYVIIAKVAVGADKETQVYEEILKLASLKYIQTDDLIFKLLEKAVSIDTPNDEAKIIEIINQLKINSVNTELILK